MKVKLLRDVKPFGRTGEIVEVSPVHFEWLTSLGMAEPVKEAREQAVKPEPKAEPKAEKKQPKAAAKKK